MKRWFPALSVLFLCTVLLMSSAVGSTDQHRRAQNSNLLLEHMTDPVAAFENWRVLHQKPYEKGSEEWQRRYSVWLENLDVVVAYNDAHDSHWLTMTSNADMPAPEVTATRLGFSGDTHRSRDPGAADEDDESLDDVPASVDWRKAGIVTSVKDQGSCGACWAFSTVGSIEGANALAHNDLVSLSAQELVDCDKDNSACHGGAMDKAFQWVIDNGGIAAGDDYTYRGLLHLWCNRIKRDHHRVNIGGYRLLPVGETGLIRAIARQPVSIAVDASQSGFHLYGGGIFDTECGLNLNHAMLAVGYNLEEKYFILKNSWGESWGEEGYIRLPIHGNNSLGHCGVAMYPSYPIADTSAESKNKCGAAAFCAKDESCCCVERVLNTCKVWGCCPVTGATCCGDGKYCCPAGYDHCLPHLGLCSNGKDSVAGLAKLPVFNRHVETRRRPLPIT